MKAYQLKISLKGTKPLIWRRIIVPSGITFEQLHETIIDAMGWIGYHLYEFQLPDLETKIVDNLEEYDCYDDLYDPVDARNTLIDSMLERSKWFTYVYDFGDWWEHRIDYEKCIENYPNSYPTVIKAKGNCPPEDCGGVPGYYDLLEIMNNPLHPEYESMKVFIEQQGYEQYDIDTVNQLMEYELDFSEKNTKSKQQLEDENKNLELNNQQLMNVLNDIIDDMEEHESLDKKLLKSQVLEEFKQLEKPDSLDTIMNQYSVEEIKDIARQLSIKGYSKYRKEELIKYVITNMLDEKIATKYFLGAKEEELKAFEKACQSSFLATFNDFELFTYLLKGGYVTFTSILEVIVPKEVKELYHNIKTEAFLKKHKRIDLLGNYCRATNTLYGVVPLDKVVEIFNEQNKEKTTKEEILDAYGRIKNNMSFVDYRDGYFVDFSLMDDVYLEVLRIQGDKPYYIPSKTELLKYANYFYVERTTQYEALLKFLINEVKVDREVAEEVCDEIGFQVRNGAPFQEIFGLFQNQEIQFEDLKQANELLGFVQELSNHTRMIDNRGHTPNELFVAYEKPKLNPLPKVIPFPGASKKLYPNDKCSCGSGKKYKHCCGK
jgi:uncharacterized protein YecA (UPF0149 family)